MKYLYGTAVMAAVLAGANAEEDISSLAFQAMARATTSSEVLTINVVVLLVLVLLKMAVIGMGLFSASSASSGYASSYSARSGSAFGTSIDSSEVKGGLCLMMYMTGDETKISCIQEATCRDPGTADGYIRASKLLFKAFKLLDYDYQPKYEDVLSAMVSAENHSLNGGDCAIYRW